MTKVTVNGTELYYEVRGTGPPVLLIMGATGDGGHLDALADALADEFTVASTAAAGTASDASSPYSAAPNTGSPQPPPAPQLADSDSVFRACSNSPWAACSATVA